MLGNIIKINQNLYLNNNHFLLIKNSFYFSKLFCKKKENKCNEKSKYKKVSYFEMFKFLKPYYSSPKSQSILLKSFGITLFSRGIGNLSPIFIKKGINKLISSQNAGVTSNFSGSINYIILSYISKMLSKILGEYRNVKLDSLNNEIISKFGNESFDYINSIPYLEFKNNSEQIISQISKTSDRLDKLNRIVIGNLMSNLTEIIFVSYSMTRFLGKKYLFTTLGAYATYITYSKILSKYRNKLYNQLNFWEIKSDNKLYDIVNNIETIKAFQGEEKEKKIYNNILSNIKDQSRKIRKSLSYLNSGQNIIMNSCLMINIINCIREVIKGKLTPGDIFMLEGFFNQMMIPLNIMGFLMREIERCRVQLRYGILLRENYKKVKKSHMNESENINIKDGKIKFNNVSFSYGDKNKLIKNLNIEFEPNKLNCIVGESGEGKSTLFELILKLVRPSEGKIFIDDIDLSKVDENSLRKYISFCPQNGSLFNDSFLYNLLYAIKKYEKEDYEKLIHLLKKLNLYKKIKSLNDGMNTYVGTLGNKLSGGEKQRILLIRALMKPDSKIFLLDEPTSNLDIKNSDIVFNILKNELKNKTILFTSHKISTIKMADKIFVLHDGQIVEQGNYNDLIKKKGFFYKLMIDNVYKAPQINRKLL